MNTQSCNEPCRCGEAISTAPPAGIVKVREAFDHLGRPCTVTYTGIVKAEGGVW
jgi:hypothetical protein